MNQISCTHEIIPFSSDWRNHKFYSYWIPTYNDSYGIKYSKWGLLQSANTLQIRTVCNPLLDLRFDDAFLGICEDPKSNPPNKPCSPPEGSPIVKVGSEYKFTISSQDPDGDQIFFMWDWGDGSRSNWLGRFESDEICEASHIWNEQGNFSVMVKVKDIHGGESMWSLPLVIRSFPKSKSVVNTQFLLLQEKIINRFSLLSGLLNK